MALALASVKPDDDKAISRTISARYHKDGSESLVDRGWDSELGEKTLMTLITWPDVLGV